MFLTFSVKSLFRCFIVRLSSRPALHNILHTSMAWHSLFVLKVPSNTDQPTDHMECSAFNLSQLDETWTGMYNLYIMKLKLRATFLTVPRAYFLYFAKIYLSGRRDAFLHGTTMSVNTLIALWCSWLSDRKGFRPVKNAALEIRKLSPI